MPTPLEILFDPISLGVIAIYATLIVLELAVPATALPRVKGWLPRAMMSFVLYFYLSSYLPLVWDGYLANFQLFNLSSVNPWVSAILALLVFNGLLYVWHRSMHRYNCLWRSFHQMHHSAERVDTFGTFYLSPLDMVGFTMLGSLSLVLVLGVPPEAATYFLFISMFLVVFQHTHINTPQWLGYFIQRPESHSIHHSKGIHRYNYADLPIFDILFGTFKNPVEFAQSTGFYHGASAKIPAMLLCQEISTPQKQSESEILEQD